MLKDKTHRVYKKEDAQKYIDNIIQPMGQDVLGHYADFIHSLIK